MNRLLQITLLIQGVYYAITGIWPIVSIETFEAVTGPKTDHWLVQTVGALVTVMGLALLASGWQRNASAETMVLAIGGTIAFSAVDIIFTMKGVIDPIYLADAGAQIILLMLLVAGFIARAREFVTLRDSAEKTGN